MPPRRLKDGVLWLCVAYLGVICEAQVQGLRGRISKQLDATQQQWRTHAGLNQSKAMVQWAVGAGLHTAEVSFKQAVDTFEELAEFRAWDVIGTGALLDDGGIVRAVNDLSPSKDELLPLCGWVEPVVELSLYCPLIRYFESKLRPSLIQRTSLKDAGLYHHDRAPVGGDTLPKPLNNVGAPLPYLIDHAVVEDERHTYYWYFRNIINTYGYAIRFVRAEVNERVVEPPPLVPEGWGSSRVYKLDEGWGSIHARFPVPIGHSFVKGDHMVLLFRGTLLPGGWFSDLTYAYSPLNVSSVYGFEGRIHQGFFNFTMDVLPGVEDELSKHPSLKRVTIAGHSLGGAVGTLLADYLCRKRPDLTIEMIGIAAPNVGNTEFVRSFNRRVNARRLMYLGSGVKTEEGPFGFGDIIPQIPPPCWRVPSCTGSFLAGPDTLGEDGWEGGFEYKMVGGNVPFYATDMPNTEAWLEKEQVVTRDSSLGACHLCSYLCWSVQGLPDEEDRCYFPYQNKDFPCPYATLGEHIDNILSGERPMGGQSDPGSGSSLTVTADGDTSAGPS